VDVIAAAAARELERWRGGAYSPGVDGLAVARLGEVQRRVARAAEHSIDVAYAVADEKLEGLLAQVDILIAYVHRYVGARRRGRPAQTQQLGHLGSQFGRSIAF
jgi:hypothetical protein